MFLNLVAELITNIDGVCSLRIKRVRGDDYDDRMTTTTMTGLMAR
jgi:hypothetical protein